MKILITGANGYLGRGIASELAKRNHKVKIADMKNEYNLNLEVYDCDIFSIDDPYQFFGEPDVLLHLAWRNGFVHNDNSHFDDLPNHIQFLEKFIETGKTRISVMGTMHEIGFFEGAVNENTPCFPMNNYGIAKNALRNYLFTQFATVEKNFQWLRAFYIVDNTSYGNSIFSKIVKSVEANIESFPLNSGKNLYDFLDYSEFCEYVASIITQDEVRGIINVCSGNPQRLSERVEVFIKENKLNIKLEYGKFPDRVYDSKAIWGDNEKLLKIIKKSK